MLIARCEELPSPCWHCIHVLLIILASHPSSLRVTTLTPSPHPSFLLTSAYHYGTDMTSRWHSLPSYVSPSLFEDRVTDLFIPYISALTNVKPAARPPTLPPARTRLDLVLFASTSWDLAGWTKDDLAAGRPAASDLDETRLVEWRARSVDMLSALDKAFPRASIAWRSEGVPLKSEAETLEMWTGDKADSTTQVS